MHANAFDAFLRHALIKWKSARQQMIITFHKPEMLVGGTTASKLLHICWAIVCLSIRHVYGCFVMTRVEGIHPYSPSIFPLLGRHNWASRLLWFHHNLQAVYVHTYIHAALRRSSYDIKIIAYTYMLWFGIYYAKYVSLFITLQNPPQSQRFPHLSTMSHHTRHRQTMWLYCVWWVGH